MKVTSVASVLGAITLAAAASDYPPKYFGVDPTGTDSPCTDLSPAPTNEAANVADVVADAVAGAPATTTSATSTRKYETFDPFDIGSDDELDYRYQIGYAEKVESSKSAKSRAMAAMAATTTTTTTESQPTTTSASSTATPETETESDISDADIQAAIDRFKSDPDSGFSFHEDCTVKDGSFYCSNVSGDADEIHKVSELINAEISGTETPAPTEAADGRPIKSLNDLARAGISQFNNCFFLVRGWVCAHKLEEKPASTSANVEKRTPSSTDFTIPTGTAGPTEEDGSKLDTDSPLVSKYKTCVMNQDDFYCTGSEVDADDFHNEIVDEVNKIHLFESSGKPVGKTSGLSRHESCIFVPAEKSWVCLNFNQETTPSSTAPNAAAITADSHVDLSGCECGPEDNSPFEDVSSLAARACNNCHCRCAQNKAIAAAASAAAAASGTGAYYPHGTGAYLPHGTGAVHAHSTTTSASTATFTTSTVPVAPGAAEDSRLDARACYCGPEGDSRLAARACNCAKHRAAAAAASGTGAYHASGTGVMHPSGTGAVHASGTGTGGGATDLPNSAAKLLAGPLAGLASLMVAVMAL
ncbi:hypothetical protein BROUX41_000643 [Berkeleyomyces rouxiae]|uniref:uncharacterized protein n=1 Tax=Berkeleyomyces rouxiae TaxID=2035830 RepID=UPI003B767ABE